MCRLYIWDARVYMCEEERRAAQVEDLQCREDDPDPRSAAFTCQGTVRRRPGLCNGEARRRGPQMREIQ